MKNYLACKELQQLPNSVGSNFNYNMFGCFQVWSHFDAGSCPGSAVGVRCRLDNGCSGFIHIKNLSDKKVIDPTERVKVRFACFCMILCLLSK